MNACVVDYTGVTLCVVGTHGEAGGSPVRSISCQRTLLCILAESLILQKHYVGWCVLFGSCVLVV